jgi:hypothetical protein
MAFAFTALSPLFNPGAAVFLQVWDDLQAQHHGCATKLQITRQPVPQ